MRPFSLVRRMLFFAPEKGNRPEIRTMRSRPSLSYENDVLDSINERNVSLIACLHDEAMIKEVGHAMLRWLSSARTDNSLYNRRMAMLVRSPRCIVGMRSDKRRAAQFILVSIVDALGYTSTFEMIHPLQ